MSRILLVEDSPLQARVVSGSLEGTEYEVDTVDRLSEALQLVADSEFDAVILDLTLPDSDGLDTYLRMQAAAPETPIVVLTSINDEQLALDMLRNGAQDYLIKDEVTCDWILRSVRYAVERSNAARRLRNGARRSRSESDLDMEVDRVDEVTVLRLRQARLAGQHLAEQLSSMLFKLADESGYRKFVLDCNDVDYISNPVLSKLLEWDQKIRQLPGSLRICNLKQPVQDQIKARRLLAQFDICLDEATALRTF